MYRGRAAAQSRQRQPCVLWLDFGVSRGFGAIYAASCGRSSGKPRGLAGAPRLRNDGAGAGNDGYDANDGGSDANAGRSGTSGA